MQQAAEAHRLPYMQTMHIHHVSEICTFLFFE